jgi:putative ABC transport system ATP-binding protein
VRQSTVLNILGLLDSADAGTVRLFGEPAPSVGSAGARKLLRTRLGYLFQDFALIDSDTVDANLRVAQTYSTASRSQRDEDRAKALDRVGLAGAARRRTFELSGGEQQRVAIARLLLKSCELVLADEPTGSLDADNRDHVLRMLHEMRDSGRSIVLVTHDPVVASSCDRSVDLWAAAATASAPAS